MVSILVSVSVSILVSVSVLVMSGVDACVNTPIEGVSGLIIIDIARSYNRMVGVRVSRFGEIGVNRVIRAKAMGVRVRRVSRVEVKRVVIWIVRARTV